MKRRREQKTGQTAKVPSAPPDHPDGAAVYSLPSLKRWHDRHPAESSKEFDDMTPSEMETEIRNLNEWVDEVKQNLPLIATKADLKALATKQELADAVAKLATKEDVEGAKEYTRLLIAATRGEIRQLKDDVGQQLTSLGTT